MAGAGVLLIILAANGGVLAALRGIPGPERAGVAGIVAASSVVTICLNLAFGLMAVALVVAIYYLYPLGVAVWGAIQGDEPLTPARAFGVVLGVLGVFVVLLPGAVGSNLSIEGLALAAAAAAGNIVVAGQAAAALAPLSDPRLVVALIAAGVATAALPSVLLPYGIRRAGATRSSTIMFGEPTSSVLFAALILGQALTLTIAAGIAAVVLGAALVNLSGRGRSSALA
jgi:drug/metabolite transporter (DMT)-like permease